MFDVVTLDDRTKKVKIMWQQNIPNLLTARKMRKVSGDVVVHSGTNRIVKNSWWLWAWELGNQYSYAYQLVMDLK